MMEDSVIFILFIAKIILLIFSTLQNFIDINIVLSHLFMVIYNSQVTIFIDFLTYKAFNDVHNLFDTCKFYNVSAVSEFGINESKKNTNRLKK